MKSRVASRKKYHHGDLRLSLLDAARIELSEKGIEGFTLRGCARRAGVSHAAPAHHFPNTDALLTALATHGFERLLEMMRKRQETATKRHSGRVAAGLGYVDFARSEPALFRLMFSSARPDRSAPALRQAADAAYALLVEAIRAERPEASARDLADEVAASWALVHGLAELILAGRMPDLDGPAGEERDLSIIRILERVTATG